MSITTTIPPNVYYIGDPINVFGPSCIESIVLSSNQLKEITETKPPYYLGLFKKGIYKSSTSNYITIDSGFIGIIPFELITNNLVATISQVGIVCNIQEPSRAELEYMSLKIGAIEIYCD